MMEEKILDISWKTILKIAIAILAFYIIYLTKDILVLFLFALIISILFNPVIDFFQRKMVPRVLSVTFIYFSIFSALSFLIYFTAPMFISEIGKFSDIFPEYFERISPVLQGLGIQAFDNLESFTLALNGALKNMSGGIFQALFSVFGGIFSTLFVMTVAIFISLEEKPVEKAVSLFASKKYESYAMDLWDNCQKKVGKWFLSRVVACLFVGVASCVAFVILNIEYPFSLGLISGVLNFIPYIGPLVTALLLFVIVGLDSIFQAVFVLTAFSLIQLIENSVLTPLLLRRFLGLPPSLLLLTLSMGALLWGVLGAILCVPLGGILYEFIKDFLKRRKENGSEII